MGDLRTRGGLELEDGFLAGCAATKALAWGGVGRKQWETAARAKEWSPVTRVFFDPWITPHWWLEKWLRNKATAGLVAIKIGTARLDRVSPGDAWELSMSRSSTWGAGHMVTLLRALPAGEL